MRKYTIEGKLEHSVLFNKILQAIGLGREFLMSLLNDSDFLCRNTQELQRVVVRMIFEEYFGHFLHYVMQMAPEGLGSMAVYLVDKPYHPCGFTEDNPSSRLEENKLFISRATLHDIDEQLISAFKNRMISRVLYKSVFNNDGLSLLRLTAAKAMVLVASDFVLQNHYWQDEIKFISIQESAPQTSE